MWVIVNEPNAFKQSYTNDATKHVDFKVEECGLFVDKLREYIGGSPDGLLYLL